MLLSHCTVLADDVLLDASQIVLEIVQSVALVLTTKPTTSDRTQTES